MEKKYLNNMTSKGVSLIEMLAAVAIFAITIGAISGIFISAIRTQRRILANQELLDRTSYILEYMGRALRMAQKDDIDYGEGVKDCLIGDKVNYEATDPYRTLLDGITYRGPGIKFRNYHNDCQEFFVDSDDLRLKESINSGAPVSLTPSQLQVFLQVNLSGENPPPDNLQQPRVTMFLDISGREAAGSRPRIQIQTSISQRSLDVAQ
jgi:prepilin-type N-terminal cleavage/methylation domain-containing protein